MIKSSRGKKTNGLTCFTFFYRSILREYSANRSLSKKINSINVRVLTKALFIIYVYLSIPFQIWTKSKKNIAVIKVCRLWSKNDLQWNTLYCGCINNQTLEMTDAQQCWMFKQGFFLNGFDSQRNTHTLTCSFNNGKVLRGSIKQFLTWN